MDDMTMGLFIFFGALIGLVVLIFLISKLISWLFPNRKPPVKYVPPPVAPLPQQYCTSCGATGSPVVRMEGSNGMFLFLLLVFLLPGIIYAIWRSSTRRVVCSRCGNASMIPLDSPLARISTRTAHTCQGERFCSICGVPMAVR
jgi:uncharacterized membrane protein